MIGYTITVGGNAAGLQRLIRALTDKRGLNAKIAVDVLELTRSYVDGIQDHDTAARLGAAPTNHLAKVAGQIESASDDRKASILVPRASRLAAAFGPVTITAQPGHYLTIPVAAESYGRRARTFTDLQFMRVGPLKTPVLARPVVGVRSDSPLAVLYVLVKQSKIAQDRTLLPFDDMREQAEATASEYLSETSKGGNPS